MSYENFVDWPSCTCNNGQSKGIQVRCTPLTQCSYHDQAVLLENILARPCFRSLTPTCGQTEMKMRQHCVHACVQPPDVELAVVDCL